MQELEYFLKIKQIMGDAHQIWRKYYQKQNANLILIMASVGYFFWNCLINKLQLYQKGS